MRRDFGGVGVHADFELQVRQRFLNGSFQIFAHISFVEADVIGAAERLVGEQFRGDRTLLLDLPDQIGAHVPKKSNTEHEAGARRGIGLPSKQVLFKTTDPLLSPRSLLHIPLPIWSPMFIGQAL